MRGDEDHAVAICHQDPQVDDDCGHGPGSEVGTGTTEVNVRLFASYQPERCAAGRCFLALMLGQNGAGPIATAPLTFENPD